jgi:putative nucleotidyltransferase with HDIG domain
MSTYAARIFPLTEGTRALLSLAGSLEGCYEDLSGHGVNVSGYCALMAEELGLEEETVEQLRLAGALHDIGKVAIDKETLLRPTLLSDDDWVQIRRHPEIGAAAVRRAGLDRIADWVLAHHERPDGSGYPFGLEAEEIPIEAKILAVADAYDAMLTDRVYRPAMSAEEAAQELRLGIGTQFDREVVEALLNGLGLGRLDRGDEVMLVAAVA